MTSKFAALALDVDKPVRMPIVHPSTRQPLKDARTGEPAYIDVLSSDSEAQRRHQRAIMRRRLQQRGRVKPNPEDIESDQLDLLAALTAGWNLCAPDGSPIDVAFSVEAARELYGEPGVAWLREQVEEFVDDRANFAKASSTS